MEQWNNFRSNHPAPAPAIPLDAGGGKQVACACLARNPPEGCIVEIRKKVLESGVVVLEVTGRVVMGEECRRVDEALAPFAGSQGGRVVLDLHGVNHIDSSAIGTFVRCYTRIKNAGGTLCLAGTAGMVDQVLRMAHVDRVIGFHPTAAAAADSLAKKPA